VLELSQKTRDDLGSQAELTPTTKARFWRYSAAPAQALDLLNRASQNTK